MHGSHAEKPRNAAVFSSIAAPKSESVVRQSSPWSGFGRIGVGLPLIHDVPTVLHRGIDADAVAEAGEGPMVAYLKSDLEFILAQIKIAEAHADAYSATCERGHPSS